MLNFLQNVRHFSGLMGDFSVQLSYGRRRCVKSYQASSLDWTKSFYVSYGDEDEGILYGVLWLGDQAVIMQTCGKVREVRALDMPAAGLCHVVRPEGGANVGDGRVGERLRCRHKRQQPRTIAGRGSRC